MKVLIVDDEKAMHLIMKRMLAKIDGVEVVGSFADTASAEAYLRGNAVDLIFIDINMPKESGMAFAQRLRASDRDVKLVFVTSHTEFALAAFDVYAYDFMVKPVVQERLHHTVRRAMAEASEGKGSAESPAIPEPQVRVNCLGRMEIRGAQGELVKWRSSKSAELCAYLVLQRGSLVSRARLIEDIFGGMPRKNAEVYLNTTAYQLRKLLEAIGMKGSLYSNANHYALNLTLAEVDLHRFEEGCREMAGVDASNLDRAIELERAYVGQLFGDLAYPWAWSEVERISQMYASFTLRLGQALLDRGDIQAAIRLLAKLTAYNELDEDTVKLYMRALALQHNREALTRLYAKFSDTLQEELGVRPSTEVTKLYGQLLTQLEAAE
ncbi:Two-component response regulator, SAPR family, consists of REC, wHTH and BTAD domains [Cohnella sp. OV330]|uniref:response regulator n=1 Tax=Cohnella sp. OV330 TaxID=1855288 RepID=UPI0008F17666|nr:response regulator [Cohnella sp. OV330]SFB56455.1 Two-component response regulator, SAPR family, consists of REC, wHTH and BTAD domains [Cohnella sp. OV330]